MNVTKLVKIMLCFLLHIDLQQKVTNLFNKKETMLQQDPYVPTHKTM
jgi:hypothetical protein